MKTRALYLALLGLAASSISCSEDFPSVHPFGICAPAEDATECAPDGPCERYLTGQAVLDTQVGVAGIFNELVFFVQFNNQLPNNDDPTTGRVNTNDAEIDEYRITFAPQDGRIRLQDRTVLTVAPPVPAGGLTSAIVTFIPEETTRELADQMATLGLGETLVTAEVRAAGRYWTRTDRFETAPFKLPVRVVNAVFTGFQCQNPTDVVVAVCPNVGQTATFACEAPPAP